jgi:hypothetical protein
MGLIFKSIPINSYPNNDSDKKLEIIQKTLELPQTTQDLMFSPATGSYIRGVAKNNLANLKLAPKLAWLILRITLGKVVFPELPSTLKQEFNLEGQKAEELAKNIEKDLFAPVALEWNEWLQKQASVKQQPKKAETTENKNKNQGVQNVVNLKDDKSSVIPKPPRPPKPKTANLK